MRVKALLLSCMTAAGLLAGASVSAGAAPLPLLRPAVDRQDIAAPVVRIDNDGRYYNGYRGYKTYRKGYVQRNGWWYPPKAFPFGNPKPYLDSRHSGDSERYRDSNRDRRAAPRHYVAPPFYATPRRNAAPPRYARGMSPAHYQWCSQRYRSYRPQDNSFQPYHGPRRGCVSPYGP